MRVGAARVDITPPLGMAMDGYEARASGATGVHDPLHVRALVVEGADGTTVALVVADLLQVLPRLQGEVAAEIEARTGITRERLQLVGTHTHSGPDLGRPSDAEQAIGDRMVEAVESAWRARQDAVAAVGVGRVEGIGANRRPDGGPVDDRVTVTRFDALDGSPIATHVNYGCHPTTLGPDNTLYSADYPGVLCRIVDEAVGGVTIFSTGPQGDVNPGGYSPEGSMVGVVVPWRTFESAERYGRALADVTLDVRAALAPDGGRVGPHPFERGGHKLPDAHSPTVGVLRVGVPPALQLRGPRRLCQLRVGEPRQLSDGLGRVPRVRVGRVP